MREWDSAVFHAVNRWPESWSPFFRFMSEATNETPVRVGLLLVVLAMLLAKGRWARGAVQALLAFPLANEITDVWKFALPMNRPFQIEEVILRAGSSDSMGTASAHSANMAAVAFAFAYHQGLWGYPWIVIAFFVGLSRIYNGVHYPSQVLLGWACGAFAAFVVIKTWEAIVLRRNRVHPTTDAQQTTGDTP
jgi:undecaprenyl-diphosphatase